MKQILSSHLLLACFVLFGLTACVDQEFDTPPAGGMDPALTPNATIGDLRAMHVLGAYEEITEDLIIDAVVISNDEAGNFFRQLVIQDETGGIEIRIDRTNLFNNFPPGRKVFIKAQGLWLGDFNNLIQLGAAVVEDEDGDLELLRIPDVLLEDFIEPGTFGNEVVPKIKAIDDLTFDDVSTLIQLEGVQFTDADAGVTYADAVLMQSENLDLEDCNKDQVLLRSSGFASFASAFTPAGNGTLIGVLGIFGDDLQMVIRDLNDVSMDGERCAIGGGNRLSIESVRQAFESGANDADLGFIQGVVISDFTTGNVTGRNLFIQDGEFGIVLRFEENHPFGIGEELQVEVTGVELSEFRGLLQLNDIPSGNAISLGQGTLPNPRKATVSEINANSELWESTLVEIESATLSGNSVFSGTVIVSDGSGTIDMFTRSGASFANETLPSGAITMTAIVSEFDAPQVIIRDLDDVGGGGGDTTSPGGDIEVDFNNFADNEDIMISGWVNEAVKGDRLWRNKVFDGNHYAQATAFNDSSPEMEVWLITSEIDLSTDKVLNFETAYGFYEHDGLTVWISSNFSGSIAGATWTQLDGNVATSTDVEHDFVPFGEVDLSVYSGKVRIGFKYEGSGPSGATTSYRIDNIVVSDK